MAEDTTATNAAEGDSRPPEVAGGEAAVDVPAPENGNNGSASSANQDPESVAAGEGESHPPAPPVGAADDAAAAAVHGDAPPDAAAAGEPAGGPVRLPALANDLSTFFTALQNALRRQNSSNGNSAAGIGTSMMALLHDGVAPIVAAGNANGGNTTLLAFENAPSGGAGGDASRAAAISPAQAGLYLHVVAQNIVALEAAVLGSSSMFVANTAATGGAAGLMAGMVDGMMGGPRSVGNGGFTAKQVAEIISAVSIAATFCSCRSIITQSGILPALCHLIESTGTVSLHPSAYLKKSNKSKTPLHALTPFHPEFLQCSLLAGQYHYAKCFLKSHPTSHMTLSFPYLRIEPATYLRTHYYGGLVHVGCEDWNAALDSFHLCLTIPCSNVSAISVAARKKQLLVKCILLESEELDGNNNGSGTKSNVEIQARGSGGSGKPSKSVLENKVFDLPGAASAAVNKYMTASSSRIVSGGTGNAGSGSGTSEREAAGSESSEQPPGRASRRRNRSNNPENAGGSGEGSMEESNNRSASNNNGKAQSHLGSYHDLISTYISGNASHYAKLLIEMKDLLHGDGNWGLAKRLEGRLAAYRSIRKVASVYDVVSLDVLEKKMMVEGGDGNGGGTSGEIGRRGLEDLLMGMASCDAKEAALLVDPFIARIDQSTGMVSFADDYDESTDVDDDSTEMRMEADLSHRLQSCISLAERVRDLDVALTTSAKYQQHAMKEMMMKGGSGDGRSTMKQGGGSSVADIGHGPMDIGGEW